MYWYAFDPWHSLVFNGTVREICARAERLRI
jgi:hypothetical protein